MHNKVTEMRAYCANPLRTYKAFDYYGVIVEEWMVRFDGETDTYRRVVTKLK